jgi:hypothetical protein
MLPEPVATHFRGDGTPDGWMSRAGYLAFLVLLGASVSMLVACAGWALQLLPPWLISIPNRAYWLAPARRCETLAFLQCHLLWLACLMVGFFLALHLLTVGANELVPVRLPTTWLILVLGGFVGALGIWIGILVGRFRRRLR